MKLIQFNGCKKFAVFIIIIVLNLFIYYEYHNLFNTIGDSYQRVSFNETAESSTCKSDIDVTTSKRVKRFLISQGGGVVKLVFGTSFPIMMADKKRSLNYFYNFQMQYSPPTIPLYWWSFYNTSTFVVRTSASKRSTDMLKDYDESRSLIYDLIETVLQRSGYFGKECLLKVICEVARAPLTEDLHASEEETRQLHITDKDGGEIVDDYGRIIYHKLINAIFMPLRSNVNERYINAREAGKNGANCDETFGECPIVEQLFNRYTQLI